MLFCEIIMNTYRKFFNPENPGITRTQYRDFGIGKIGRDPGIRDPGIAIPKHKKVRVLVEANIHNLTSPICKPVRLLRF